MFFKSLFDIKITSLILLIISIFLYLGYAIHEDIKADNRLQKEISASIENNFIITHKDGSLKYVIVVDSEKNEYYISYSPEGEIKEIIKN